jgi:DNA-binding NtrC family response regulator
MTKDEAVERSFERESGNVSQMRFYGGRNLAKAERDLVLATLKQCSNNRVQTAKVLGMPRSTLDKKLKQYAASGVPVPPAQNGGFRAPRWSSQGPSERQGRRF